MNKILLSVFMMFTLMVSVPSYSNTGGTPNIPCFRDGQIIASSIEPYKCEKMGGTVSPDADLVIAEQDRELENTLPLILSILVGVLLI